MSVRTTFRKSITREALRASRMARAVLTPSQTLVELVEAGAGRKGPIKERIALMILLRSMYP